MYFPIESGLRLGRYNEAACKRGMVVSAAFLLDESPQVKYSMKVTDKESIGG